MKNGVPVHVHIHNEIQQGTEKETIEFWTTGVYSEKNEAIFISYEEEHDFGNVKSLLKITDNELYLMRSGAVQMRQRFIEKEETVSNYETQFGTFRLSTYTKSLGISTNEALNRGTLKVEYDLKLGQEQHVHTLTIKYKEEHRE